MMKILYTITGLTVGGAERIVIDLADNFSSLGHDVKIVYLKGSSELKPKNKNIDLICLNLNGVNNLFSAIVEFKKIVSDFKPDVLHSNLFHANIFSRVLRFFCNIPFLVCSSHNSNESGYFKFVLYKITNFLSDINTNVSSEAVDKLVNKGIYNKNQIIAVHNGIDTNHFIHDEDTRKIMRKKFNIGNSTKCILSVGRMTPEKDYITLIKAVSLLKYLDFKLFIVGDGKEFENINKLIIESKLNDKVFLLGRRTDIRELMSMTDLFVLSSYTEGFGLVVAEAMSCERIVVATDCGGVKEVLNNDDYLVPIKKPDILAEKIKFALLNDEESCILIGKNNRDHIIKNFSLDCMAKNWLNIYQKAER